MVDTRKLAALLLGQVLSMLITGTGVTASLLATRDIFMPATQTFANYVCMLFTFTFALFVRGELYAALKERGAVYFFLALADVEANFLVTKAYQYTTITSVMLLDCVTIPFVMLLSYMLFKVRYSKLHYGGVVVCVCGLVLLVVVDSDKSSASNAPLGDLLCIGGAALYACSNVGQEFSVKVKSPIEFLGMFGLFGFVISGIQAYVLEWTIVTSIAWSSSVVLLLVGFVGCLFTMYALAPVLLLLSSATFMNLSLLTSDVMSFMFAIFLFHNHPSPVYIVAFVVIITGVVMYNSGAEEEADWEAFAATEHAPKEHEHSLEAPSRATSPPSRVAAFPARAGYAHLQDEDENALCS